MQAGAASRHGTLTVRGNEIVGAAGEPVMLRGVSLFWSQWMPQFYNPAAIRWLRDDWHIDVVRAPLAVHRGGYLEHPEVELRKIVNVIEAAIELGIYVIVDWHCHDPELPAAQKFFGWLAREYHDCPNIIYEIWNEPLGKYTWEEVIRPHHECVAAVIREYDARNLIIAGTPHWSHRVDIAGAAPLRIENVAYALHFYAGTNGAVLRDLALRARRQPIALFVTEWGAGEASGDGRFAARETLEWLAFLEEQRISHVNWSICDKIETCAALKPGVSGDGRWSQAELTASGSLVREHLAAMSLRAEPRT